MDRIPEPADGPRPPRRAPRQRRSRELVDAILQAASELLEERGPDSLTTNDIALRAGISIGSLYRYFPDKASVIAALIGLETNNEARALSKSEWPSDGRTLESTLASVVDYQLNRHRRLIARAGDLVRKLDHESSLTDRMGADEVEAAMRQALEGHRERVIVGDLDQCAFLLVRGLSSIVRMTLREHPEKLEQPSFRQELIDLTLRYVLGSSPPQ